MPNVYMSSYSSLHHDEMIYRIDYVQNGEHKYEVMMGSHHDFFFSQDLNNEQIMGRYGCDEVLECFRVERFEGKDFTSTKMLVYKGEWIYPVKEILGDMFTVGIGPVYDIQHIPLEMDADKGFYVVDGELRFC